MKTRFFLIAWLMLITSLTFGQKAKTGSGKFIKGWTYNQNNNKGTIINTKITDDSKVLSSGLPEGASLNSIQKPPNFSYNYFASSDIGHIEPAHLVQADTILVRILYSKKYAVQTDSNNWVKWTMGYQIVGTFDNGYKRLFGGKNPVYDRDYSTKTIGYLTIDKQPFPDDYEVWLARN